MTSKHWLRTFGARTAKILFALCLLVSCISFGAGDPVAQTRALQGKPAEEQLRLLERWSAKGQLEPSIKEEVDSLSQAFHQNNMSERTLKRRLERVTAELELRSEGYKSKWSDDPVALAKEIKSSPMYKDPGLKSEANWLSSAANRLNNIQPSCDSCNADVPNVNGVDAPDIGNWLTIVMWTVLGGGVIAFGVFAYKRFSWSLKLERKAKALLDEDEPERTLDEWLERADLLEKQGKHREAVRCLYLACLLKIDEARIERFERSQTNWEHLARIEASPRRPANLNFRAPTQAFDQIWYGMRVNGAEDVAKFRAWYRQVTEAVRPKAA